MPLVELSVKPTSDTFETLSLRIVSATFEILALSNGESAEEFDANGPTETGPTAAGVTSGAFGVGVYSATQSTYVD